MPTVPFMIAFPPIDRHTVGVFDVLKQAFLTTFFICFGERASRQLEPFTSLKQFRLSARCKREFLDL